MILRFCLFIFLTSCTHFNASRKLDKLSILQGITNAKEVEFSIMANKSEELKFELQSAEGESIIPEETKIITRDYSPYAVHKVLFTWGPEKEYNLIVKKGADIVDQRLVGKGQKEDAHLTLAMVSSINDKFEKDFKIWETLAAKHPEYLLFIGDAVITDADTEFTTQATNPEIIWNRYAETRLNLPLFFQEKLIPVHALWDDHDYGEKNGNRFYPHREESKDVFETFYAQSLASLNYSQGFGVGGLLSLGDFNFYFLDSRTFRSKDYEGNHLGYDQSSWFNSKIKEENTPSLIVKGDSFFGNHRSYESFEGRHPEDFKNFTNELTLTKTPVVFLSGDNHVSEIMQFPRGILGRPSFEITTGALHDKIPTDESATNPWRVVANTQHPSFTILKNVAREDHWFLDVENIGINGEVYYRRELAVYIKDLQDNLKEVRKRRHGRRRYKRIKRGRR